MIPTVIPDFPTKKQLRNAILRWYDARPKWWQIFKVRKWLAFPACYITMSDLRKELK